MNGSQHSHQQTVDANLYAELKKLGDCDPYVIARRAEIDAINLTIIEESKRLDKKLTAFAKRAAKKRDTIRHMIVRRKNSICARFIASRRKELGLKPFNKDDRP